MFPTKEFGPERIIEFTEPHPGWTLLTSFMCVPNFQGIPTLPSLIDSARQRRTHVVWGLPCVWYVSCPGKLWRQVVLVFTHSSWSSWTTFHTRFQLGKANTAVMDIMLILLMPFDWVCKVYKWKKGEWWGRIKETQVFQDRSVADLPLPPPPQPQFSLSLSLSHSSCELRRKFRQLC